MRRRIVPSLLCAIIGLATASRGSAQDTSVVKVSNAPFQWRYAFEDARTAWLKGQVEAPMAQAILLRFQLIKAMDTKNTDPDIASIDAVLKDLFRFPGYKLLSQAAVAVDFTPPGAGGPRPLAQTTQQLSGEGRTYNLIVSIDSVTATTVRMSIRLMGDISNASIGNLFSTTLSVSFGKTVVLGSTQPAGLGGNAPNTTLILAVKPEIRQ